VGKTDLPRANLTPAAEDSLLTGAVVRGAEGRAGNKTAPFFKETGEAV